MTDNTHDLVDMTDNTHDLVGDFHHHHHTRVGKDAAVVVIVDPYSTGGCLPILASRRGYDVIALWTDEVNGQEDHIPAETAKWIKSKGYLAEVHEKATVAETAEALASAACGRDIVAMLCGGESGVKVADATAEFMGLPGNGTAGGLMENRRDKQVQQNALKATGIRAVRGLASTVWEGEVEAFVDSETFPVVVKPVESAGSEGVKLCRTKEEAHDHFHLLMTTQRALGAAGAAVLCQEFLRGEEYVVDHVTKDGEHKTMMVWKYDKRPRNGSQFVYFGMDPVSPTSATGQALIQYTRCALAALKITNGATHSEIMMTADGPCLVEVNCRCHGGNGAWLPLASTLTGSYNQVTAYVDSAVDADAWAKIPSAPVYPFAGAGSNVIFCSYVDGVVTARPGYDAIKKLRSFQSLEEAVQVGDTVHKSVDLFTSPGQCILVHPNQEVLDEDIRFVRNLENTHAMFELENGALPDVYRESKRGSARLSLNERFSVAGDEQLAALRAQNTAYERELALERQKKRTLAAAALVSSTSVAVSLLLLGKRK